MKTIYDLAIWHNNADGETYAFPIGAKDILGDEVIPAINYDDWTGRGVLPKGLQVTNVRPVTGNRVRCTIAGITMNTADWAFR